MHTPPLDPDFTRPPYFGGTSTSHAESLSRHEEDREEVIHGKYRQMRFCYYGDCHRLVQHMGHVCARHKMRGLIETAPIELSQQDVGTLSY